jgi:hypothetical protein
VVERNIKSLEECQRSEARGQNLKFVMAKRKIHEVTYVKYVFRDCA